jgi:hypothetical protein
MEDENRAKIALRDAFDFARSDMSKFEQIGKVRIEYKKTELLPQNHFKVKNIDPDHFLCSIYESKKFNEIKLKSESHKGFDVQELDDIFPQKPVDAETNINHNLMLTGLTPGTGKTSAVIDHCKRHDRKLLVVCSWNRLRCELSQKTDIVSTYHNLFGLVPDNVETDESNHNKGINLEKLQPSHIHFEEVYLFSIGELVRIFRFIQENKHTYTFSGAGDSFQLKAVSKINPKIKYDEYHDQIFAKMFPNKLVLQHCKRCTTEEDSIEMLTICNELRAFESVEDIVDKYFKSVTFESLEHDKEAAMSAHVTFTKRTASIVNSWAFPLKTGRSEFKYQVGDVLLGNPSDKNKNKMFKGKGGKVRIASNNIYTIKAIDGDNVSLLSLDDKYFTLDITYLGSEFKRDCAVTCHSSQGLTLGKKLYVHDYLHPGLDNRWYFTALTRCSSLDIIFVKSPED